MTKVPKPLGRVAFRVEGTMWNAYFAVVDSMKDAILLGSIAMGLVLDNPERKRAFMELMKGAVGEVLEEQTGALVEGWEERPGPEHERGGHG
jgi:hypothetical protein